MKEENAGSFWENLDKIRKGGKSLKEACSELGIAYQRIADQRTDCRFPKLEDSFLLAKYYGVSIEYLLTGQDPYQLSAEAKAVNKDSEHMKISALGFWNRVDESNSSTLKELCIKAGVDYKRVMHNRTDCRVPKAEDMLNLSKSLNVSIEYLLTGQDPYRLSAEAKAVNEDPELQAVVRAIVRDRRLLHVISAVVESSERTMAGSGA